jgi:predicted nucleic acid-binding protein
VYLETTIPSYLTSRPSRDLIIAGHQEVTREWWEWRRDSFHLYISQLVIDEISAGNLGAARERLKSVRTIPLLDITPDVAELASRILAAGKIPRKAAADAAHIAIAAVHGMDFLVTWNCVHIANATNARALARICRKQECECPVICTPEELMGE